jgi:hypothetical protein
MGIFLAWVLIEVRHHFLQQHAPDTHHFWEWLGQNTSVGVSPETFLLLLHWWHCFPAFHFSTGVTSSSSTSQHEYVNQRLLG